MSNFEMMFEEEELGFSKCHRILDTRLLNFIQQTAMQLNDPELKRYPSFRFPGGMPITVESRHTNAIRTGNYLFTAKADGIRVLLLFLHYYIEGDWRNLCVMLARDGSAHLLKVNAPPELNENGGSLFDCELVQTNNGWMHLLLFDCYSYKGVNLRQLQLNRRFARCEKLAETCVHEESNSVIITSKPYFNLSKENLDTAVGFLQNKHYLPYQTDGIVLVPPGKVSCIHGRDETQFKLKTNHTVDLILLQDTDDEDKPYYLASYDDTDDSYIIKQQVSEEEYASYSVNTIFECNVTNVDDIHTFSAVKVRSDKTHPNSETVVKRTLRTIADNIGPEALMVS
tara:strand:+ start:2046 stop:3068 length:1023 start_codon:yes stop_codon:yes gene_type:complete